jgi:Tol biopolymer transport system component
VTGQLAYAVAVSRKWPDNQQDLHLLDASGSDRMIYSARGEYFTALAWAPDGAHLAFVAPINVIDNCCYPALYEIGSRGGTPVLLFNRYHAAPEGSPRYSHSGRLAYGASSGLPPGYGIFIDSVFAFPGVKGALDWTPDEQALVLTQSTDLVRLNLADGSVTRIWSSPGDTLDEPAVSPDGTRIAFLRHMSPSTPSSEVWAIGIDGSAPIQLASGHWNRYPAWTADGHYVAFSRRFAPGAEGVYLVPAVGGTASRIVALADTSGGPIAWSR